MISRLSQIICAALAISTTVGLTDTGHRPTNANPFLPSDVAPPTAERWSGCVHCQSSDSAAAESKLIKDFFGALHIMQNDYFEPWLGQWPRAIDWTAAVIGTYLAGAMNSVSRGLSANDETREKENLIATYFSQLLSYYFGQDAFAIRNEAYDDILWVVLGWMEAIQFIDFHNDLYRQTELTGDETRSDAGHAAQGISVLRNQSWHGSLWVPAFAHRARIFWDLAAQGWDTALCDGGMTWDPRLAPYKNAITNELFIAASASMYLYFPGDPYRSPFVQFTDQEREGPAADSSGSETPHEAKHLLAALAGYKWLTNSGMRNEQGLYTDGFHISRWDDAGHPNTRCDKRNDMVYTYNQGVLLTGLIGLWKVSGDAQFLRDGHQLVQSVINATGYDLSTDGPVDLVENLGPGQLPQWHGMGRAGILEEQCDMGGLCSQNSQTFKGIFFHHLTTFCVPVGGRSSFNAADKQTEMLHKEACASYLGWIRHNAEAALATRDSDGRFGMWWTAGILPINASAANAAPANPLSGENSVDYRTFGVPSDDTWVPVSSRPQPAILHKQDDGNQFSLGGDSEDEAGRSGSGNGQQFVVLEDSSDPNNRGRGRTVETQGGGLALLRCWWEISQAYP